MRHALIALSAVAFIGCYGESVHPPDYPREEAGDEGTEVVINPEVSGEIVELYENQVKARPEELAW